MEACMTTLYLAYVHEREMKNEIEYYFTVNCTWDTVRTYLWEIEQSLSREYSKRSCSASSGAGKRRRATHLTCASTFLCYEQLPAPNLRYPLSSSMGALVGFSH